ncbi:NAD-dependent epimerase [Agromyces luteolus]|uniref:NAD-dependent epimerase/dehydratase family protein n=1 Tax=Agromyces luteolus TaxID=88373 RepID=A0A7C9HIM4_9MICO|nr:NAD(P)-dependent oxidoreductase [Agromyces luteolus]MUN07881.1 NAD-dependent epimerase/dehydratase family protein [Agromyces luteolus]GLK29232.1 NAD-dependent epimerase [Agromyces luteolus]
MRVVVTGSSGRLGRSLATGLAELGHEVVGLDRAPAGLVGVDERTVDLAVPGAAARVLDDLRPDALVHLAGIAVPFSAPERDILLTNTALAHDVLSAAASAGVARVLAASSPTPIGYSSPAWRAAAVPIDETHPLAPANAYALSKVVIEETVRMFARTAPGAFGFFRPCYVISPEEWAGAPTQQGHTVAERLADPALAAVSLFNYVDARDVAGFVDAWLAAPADAIDGEGFFVGAADALAERPVAELWREYAPALGPAADALTGTASVFSIAKARQRLGWSPTRDWRSELAAAAAASAPELHPAETAAGSPSACTSDERNCGDTRARRMYTRSAESADGTTPTTTTRTRTA